VLLLVTPTVGAEALVAAALAAAFARKGWLRSLAELACSFFTVFAVLWLATGNALGDVFPWLRRRFAAHLRLYGRHGAGRPGAPR